MTNKEVYEKCLELVDSSEIVAFHPSLNNSLSEEAFFKKWKDLGLCGLIEALTGRFPNYMHESYPELDEQKPENSQLYWWPLYDRESRRLALLKAIKLCDNATLHP